MKFQFGQSTFLLEFERSTRQVSINRKGNRLIKTSKYPYTTVRLIEKIGDREQVVSEATVGCCPLDKYSNAAGRLAALRKLTPLLGTKELRKAVWEAYQNRAK